LSLGVLQMSQGAEFELRTVSESAACDSIEASILTAVVFVTKRGMILQNLAGYP
jgi:hypothetical protein